MSFHITGSLATTSGAGQSRHWMARNSNWLSGDLHMRANHGRDLLLSQVRRVRHLGHWEANDLPRTHVNTGCAQLAITLTHRHAPHTLGRARTHVADSRLSFRRLLTLLSPHLRAISSGNTTRSEPAWLSQRHNEGKRAVFRKKNDARGYYSQSITREGSKVYGTPGKGKVGQRMAMWVNRRVNPRYVG
jgi:hypothetical protein